MSTKSDRSKIAVWGVCIFSVLLILSIGFVIRIWRARPVLATGGLEFDSYVYDAGIKTDAQTVSHTFTFKNVGSAPIRLGKPKTTCSCTTVASPDRTYYPGEVGTLDVVLKLGTAGVNRQSVMVPINTSQDPIVLRISATYEPPITFKVIPTRILIPNSGSFHIDVSVFSHEDAPVEINTITSRSKLVDVKITSTEKPSFRGVEGLFQTIFGLELSRSSAPANGATTDQLEIAFRPPTKKPLTVPVKLDAPEGTGVVIPSKLVFLVADGHVTMPEQRVEVRSWTQGTPSLVTITNPDATWLVVKKVLASEDSKASFDLQFQAFGIPPKTDTDDIVSLVIGVGDSQRTVPVAIAVRSVSSK